MKKNLIIYLVILIITLVIFYPFITMHYATDTYNIIDRGYVEYALKYSLNDGRPVMCLISLFADYVKMPITVYIISLTIIAIIISCINVMILKKIIEKYKKPKDIANEIILTIICYTTIFNFLFLENMQFAECAVMSIGITLLIIAADILTEKKKYYIIKSLSFVIIGILFYQGAINIFVTLTVLFTIFKYGHNFKKIFKNILISGIMCVIAVVINLIQIKITGYFLGTTQTRMGSFRNIFIMIPYILKNLPSILIYTKGMFPKYMFLLYVIAIYILESSNFVSKGKDKVLDNLYLIFFITIAILVNFAPNLFTVSGFAAPRMMYSLGTLIGLMLLYTYVFTDITEKNNKDKVIFYIIAISYLILNIICYTTTIQKHKEVNKLNEKECLQIEEYLSEYERSTGNVLKYIAVCYDAKPTYYYNEIKNYTALCIRPLSVEWSDNGSINFYTNRDLKEIQMPQEIYTDFFKEKDWTSLDKEQFICINDTLYYCIY